MPDDGRRLLNFAREWVSFPDPTDADHELRADLTWLLSRWTCIFGAGCRGVVAGRPHDGCCTHGAFFTDRDDEQRVRAAARELSAADWQRHGTKQLVQTDDLRGSKARRTRLVDGACVFLNRPGFVGGAGCALHTLALRTGRHPLKSKPDVCWQLPISRQIDDIERGDGTTVRVTTITEFDRRAWGEGGADLRWWCTESSETQVGAEPLYIGYAAELNALIGPPAYAELARLCAERLAGRTPARHPTLRPQGSNL